MKIDRLIAMIMLLLEQDKISAKDLAERFEVSPRTIYRDLDTINQAGIPIVATAGPGGGVEILKTYKVEKRLFSTDDITTLLMGLGSIECNIPSHEVVTTLAKVTGMIPLEQQKELAFRANQIKIDVNPWLYTDVLSDTIALIKMALEQHRLLRFEYQDIRTEKSSREVEPYRLLLKGEDWYLQGYCLTRKDFRTFKLLRMKRLTMLEQTFARREFPYKQMDAAHFRDPTLVPATLRIHEAIRDSIVARFGEDCLTADGAEHYIATISLPVDDLVCRYLLSFGDKCICLGPEPLIEKMRYLSEQLYRFYHE